MAILADLVITEEHDHTGNPFSDPRNQPGAKIEVDGETMVLTHVAYENGEISRHYLLEEIHRARMRSWMIPIPPNIPVT